MFITLMTAIHQTDVLLEFRIIPFLLYSITVLLYNGKVLKSSKNFGKFFEDISKSEYIQYWQTIAKFFKTLIFENFSSQNFSAVE